MTFKNKKRIASSLFCGGLALGVIASLVQMQRVSWCLVTLAAIGVFGGLVLASRWKLMR